MKKTIGNMISDARNASKITQEKLSEITGLSRSYICDIENDRYRPSIKSLSKIAKVISLDLNFLTEMTEIQD